MVQVAQLHEPIVDALESGDPKRAQLLRSHSLGFAAQVGAPRQGNAGSSGSADNAGNGQKIPERRKI